MINRDASERANTWHKNLGKSKYKWVIMGIWFLMMTFNSISLTNFPLALPTIAKEFSVKSGTFSYYIGDLTYSLGLFIIYFSNIKGWANTRVRTAVLMSQIFMIVPSFLIPLSSSYSGIIILRFIQGLWFSELALSTINMKGWFGRNQIAFALAAPLSALVIGSAIGGLFEKVIVIKYGWQFGYYFVGALTLIGTIIFLAFYRDAHGYNDYIKLQRENLKNLKKEEKCPPPRKLPIAYSIGIAQIATTSAFAAIPFLVPAIGTIARFNITSISNTVLFYGILSAIGIWIGAILGCRLVSKTTTNIDAFKARNLTRTISYVLALIGFVLLLLKYDNYVFYIIGSILAALILFNIPNYWAEMGEVVPQAISGDFIYYSGAIASAGFFIGPLIAIIFLVLRHNVFYSIIFFIMLVIISEIINIIQNRLKLPIDKYK